MTDLLALLQSPVQAPAWVGTWGRVWIRPDVFSAQEFIVGAVALDQEVVHDFRVLSGAERFACVYGEDTKSLFEDTLAELRSALTQARVKRLDTNGLGLPQRFRIEIIGSLRTQLPGEGLERMLRDGTIPMEPEEPIGKKPRFATRPAVEVVQEVLERVKHRGGLAASRYVREEHYGDQAHHVDVNLVTGQSAGIVASGWFASPERVQLEFLRAGSKVDAYVAATRKENAALFFRRPTEADGLTKANWREIEDNLRELEWRLKQKGVRVVTHSDADTLAEEVVAWANGTT